ncbi:MAG: helix-hairpin-helix domain-containing protein [Provencibacterium sp.]|jgi:competence ComEA-like helix-hairpin-helix protein|nr:helix-hairpin-helix domain-containing protein [Provencibacterium sp.]
MKRERMGDRLYHRLLAAAFAAGLFAVGFNAVRAPELLSPSPLLPAYEQPLEKEDGLCDTAFFSAASPVRININSASAAELQSLPGIGEKLAKAIVEEREANGRFGSRKDLMRVRGIGEKTYEKLKDYLLI